ncbi:MAG: FtsX-like permease family protein [Actinomycetota bacterium]
MKAVRLWLRAELRAGWRGLLSLALILGIAGGAVIAAAAGARRTDSAYDRFLVAHNAADVILFDDGFLDLDVDLDAVSSLPQVADVARSSLLYYLLTNAGGVAAVDERLGRAVNRFKVLEGRLYDPRAVDEVVVGFGLARRERLCVGCTFNLIDAKDLEGLPVDVRKQYAAQNVTLKVVGIVAGPFEFPPQYAGSTASIHLTPAFFRRLGNFQADGADTDERRMLFIRLRRGAADVPAFLNATRRIAPEQFDAFRTAADLSALTKRSFHFQALGLWLLAAFAGLATLLIFGQAIARQTFLASTDHPTLSALGLRPRHLFAIGTVRALVVGLAGGLVAAAVALGLSPLTPFGDARIAEPDPGIAVDATAIGLGVLGVVTLMVAAAALPSWRAARAAKGAASVQAPAQSRPSTIATAVARTGLRAPIVAGARLALEGGRGRTAVPVRSTIAGLVLGLAVLAAALTFGASLNHLLRTPELYGIRWDMLLTSYGGGPDLRGLTRELGAIPGISALAIGTQDSVDVGGESVAFYATVALRGDPTPPIVQGRSPRSATETALGRATLRRMRLRIGDRVAVKPPFEGTRPVTYTIVGRAVIPPSGLSEAAAGEGVILSEDGYERVIREGGVPASIPIDFGGVWVRFAPGADRDAVIGAIAPLLGENADPSNVLVAPETPADVVSFGGVRNLPLLLGVIIGFVAAGTLAHAIAISARRRRADLAILKTLGFLRRQLRETVAWQATILIGAAALVGIPAGVILGRWTWRIFADQLGMVPASRVAAVQIVLLVPASLLLANLIAAIPGRAAARVRPAVILRTE